LRYEHSVYPRPLYGIKIKQKLASSLNIITNHRIQFDNPKFIIEQFEKCLNIKVVEGNRRDLHSVSKTDKFNEAKFYIHKESLEENFRKWNYVEVLSNYRPLYNFKIFKKTILIFTNLMIKYWRPLLEKDPYDESLSSQFQHTSQNWNLLKESTKTIVNQLNGSRIIFLSDDYDNISDLCYEGECNIQELIKTMTQEYSSTQLNWIQSNDFKKRLRYNWLNYRIRDDNQWELDPNEI
jgi:hypothetical protein